MRWTRGYRSDDVIDRRGESSGQLPGLGGIAVLAPLFRRLGWKGLLLMVLLAVLAGRFLGGRGGGGDGRPVGAPGTAVPQDEDASFVGFVLDDTQQTWAKSFAAEGRPYQPAHLVLFSGATPTRCGYGTTSAGPFYCPDDGNVYIDLDFYRDLRDRFGAKGDFAQAYVIAHEVGHHVQRQLGVMDEAGQRGVGARGEGGASVRVELQADCFAGVWARSAADRGLLEPGDLEEGMNAAAAVGDDRLQRQAGGAVQPESWTHGSAEQRRRWFRRGYDAGAPTACDTFRADPL